MAATNVNFALKHQSPYGIHAVTTVTTVTAFTIFTAFHALDGEARSAAVRKLDFLRAGIEARGRCSMLGAGRPYADRVLQRLGR